MSERQAMHEEPEATPEETGQTGEDQTPENTPEGEQGLTEEQRQEILQQREAKQEETARAAGWKPLDEFVAEGGDPAQWRPAGEFNLYGEMAGQIKSFQKGFENRLSRQEKLHQSQMEAQRKELESQLDQAAESGDKDEVRRINQSLRDLDQQTVQDTAAPQQAHDQQVMEQWNAQNPWINENTPKANHARTVFAQYYHSGHPVEAALREAENEVKRHFPETQGKRSVPASDKGGGNKGFQKSSSRDLSWGDLTDQEKKVYEMTKPGWKDSSEYLKAVKDQRNAEKKS